MPRSLRASLLLLVLAGASCTRESSTATASAPWTALALDAGDWTVVSDPDSLGLENDEHGRLVFDFPVDAGSMKYLYYRRPPQAIGGAVMLSLQVVTPAPVVFIYRTEPSNTCERPATVRPFIWARSNGTGEGDRWWSNEAAYPLAAGSATLTVPLTPDQWSNVSGKLGTTDGATRAAFDAALRDVSSLGLTFGGGCFFGHGVNTHGGTARFVLSDYRTQ